MKVKTPLRQTTGLLTILALFCILFAPLAPMAAPPVLADSAVGWQEMTSGTSVWLRDVWGPSADDIFAVGDSGTILHYDGSSWSSMNSSTSTHLYAVWGSSSSDVFAVGRNTIVHYDGSSWSTMTTGVPYWLWDVWGSSGSDVFAVGYEGYIYHYDGSSWSAMDSTESDYLWGVWGTASNDVFAVGNSGRVLHYDGSDWSTMTSNVSVHLYDIWGNASNDMFAVGQSGTAIHYDGSSWSTMATNTSRQFESVWGSSSSDVFTVAWPGVAFNYDGSNWRQMRVGLSSDETLNGVWGFSSSNVYAVGEDGTILHYGGGSAPTVSTGSATDIGQTSATLDLSMTDDGGEICEYRFAYGTTSGSLSSYTSWETDSDFSQDISGLSNGQRYYYQAEAKNKFGTDTGSEKSFVTRPDPPTNLTLSGDSLLSIGLSWTAGSAADRTMVRRSDSSFPAAHDEGTQVYFDSGTSTTDSGLTQGDTYYYRAWSEVTDGSQQWSDGYAQAAMVVGTSWDEMTPPSSEILRDSWGASGTDVFAVGEGGTVFHYDGGDWGAMDAGTTTAYFEGVWGSSGSDVFVVGRDGAIYHYSSSTWGSMTSNTSEHLLEVWGSSGSDVFAVGSNGEIVRYNGSYWSPMTSNTSATLMGVWGSSGSDVFAVGSSGTIMHYNGTWASMTSNTSETLNSCWGSSGSDVFAVGSDGTIMHYDGSAWTAMHSGVSVELYGVWGSSASDVFAVGAGDTILHYDGNTQGVWALMPPDTTGSAFVDVWCAASDDVFVIESFGSILHYGGIVPPSAPTVTTDSVSAVGETTATVGGNVTSDGGVTVTERGVCYDTASGPTTGDSTETTTGTTGSYTVDLSSLSPGTKYYAKAYAINSTGTGYGGEVSFTTLPVEPLSFSATADGSSRIDLSWTKGTGAEKTMVRRSTSTYPTTVSEGDEVYFNTGTNTSDLGLNPDTTYYYSAWSWVEGSDVWSDTYVTAWDATEEMVCVWSAMTSGTTETLYGVSGTSSSSAFAVGGTGTAQHYDGAAWSAASGLPTDKFFNDVWAAASDDAFAVGQTGNIYRYGGSTWGAMNSGTTNLLSAVWGSSANDVFAVGYSYTVLHYDGNGEGDWDTMSASFTSTYYDVWGSSSNDVYAVGTAATIIHYDGSLWSSVNEGIYSGVWNGVWGSSSSDVFVVGNDGAIVHYDGSTWSTMTSNTSTDLKAVWGSSSDDVFAVGYSGVVIHYDGSSWSTMTSNTGQALLSVWAASAYEVFAVGGSGTIMHYGEAPPPSAPTATTQSATSVEETTATMNGTVANDGGESCLYRFRYGTSTGVYDQDTGWTGSVGTNDDFSEPVTGLTKGQTYYYVAEVKNSAGTGSGTEVSFTTKPDEPTGFSATADGATQVALSWTRGVGAEKTMVRRQTGSPPATLGSGDEVYFDTGTSTTDAGLSQNTTYYYSAWSWVEGSDVWSDAYDTAQATTDALPVPQNVSASDGDYEDKVVVSWDAAADADSYKVYRNTSDESGSATELTTGVSGTSYDDTTVTPNNPYYYWVKAHSDTAGDSEFSTSDSGYATLISLPTLVNGLGTDITETTATGNGTITATGGENCSVRGVCWSTSENPTTADSKSEESGSFGTGAFSVSITGLDAGETYYVRAYATNSAGTGYGNNNITCPTKPYEPSDFIVSPAGLTQINMSWTKGDGATNTMIRRKEGSYPTSPSDGTQVYYSSGTSWADRWLDTGTTYYYRAWSYYVYGAQWSDEYAQGTATTDTPVWSTMVSGTDELIHAMDGTSPTNVFAVGDNGTALHYDGIVWTDISDGLPSNAMLRDLWVASSSDVFAVGEGGIIYRYNGASWSAMTSNTSARLNGVWGSYSGDVFAVGDGGTIMHYNGAAWSAMTSNTSAAMNAVWGNSGSNVFAVGNGGEIVYYDGLEWIPAMSCTMDDLYGVWGTSGTDVFAVGNNGTVVHSTNPMVWEFLTTPPPVATPLYDVWGSAADDLFVSGSMLHWDGSEFSDMGSGSADLMGVWGDSGLDVFAAGSDGTIVHYGAEPPDPPTVTTQAVSTIGATTATGNGTITDTGGQDCAARGVCWSTEHDPDVDDSTAESSGTFAVGPFTVSMTGLQPNETYYVRAYALNSGGYGYGDEVSFTTEPLVDWGDAPDPTYPTLLASNGARHVLDPTLYLGSSVDDENNGQSDAHATGDDQDAGGDDEDGVTFTSSYVAGETMTVDVVASKAGHLDAWVDFNADGDWADAGEQVFSSEPLTSGTNSLEIAVPPGANTEDATFARFRFSSVGGLGYTGQAADGEVEDYELSSMQTLELSLSAGWNMVSVAVEADNMSVSSVFPGADAVYSWNQASKSYTIPTTVEPGRGYWVAVSSPKVYEILGTPTETWTGNLEVGWNMVGSVYGKTVDFADPDDDPDGSVEGFAYSWDPASKSYVYSTSIEPGKGYWSAATQAASLTLS